MPTTISVPTGLTLTGSPAQPRGRGLVTSRAFKPGDAIALFTDPALAIPGSPSLAHVCGYCLLPDRPVRACTGCRAASYCGPSCQKADWRLVHRQECKVFQRVRDEARGRLENDSSGAGDDGHAAGTLPTPVRALVQMLLRGDMAATVAELESHGREFREGDRKEWRDLELQALAALHYLQRETNPANVGVALEMLCKLQVNSFNREDEDVGQTGLFLNPALAMVNHSCIPNAFVQFIGRQAILRASQEIKQGEEVEISYIDCNRGRAYRQVTLKERWHFTCACRRCKEDLDVYEVCQQYPHLELNRLSLNPDVNLFRNPALQTSGLSRRKGLPTRAEAIYSAWATQKRSSGLSRALREGWKLCEPLRRAEAYALEPLPEVMGEASIYFGEAGNFPYGLSISCFLALNSDSFKTPMPFGPARLKGLLMIANLLSNTAPISGSSPTASGGSLNGRLSQALSKMDQATMTQAILTIIVHWAPMAHSEEWQVYREASMQLEDIKSLRGRDKEKRLITAWGKDQSNLEGQMFFEFAVLNPVRELAGFALEIMDTTFAA
ncbi:hypothetical protein BX600DRAFT_432329 [Xylariales sp. PMI_506]|nr:hypothetical protein BX600DRAFT_432329 [Xylariales sp. PMI_506]